MIRVFIGFDERETQAFYTLSHSIHKNSSQPVAITPLIRSQLPVHPKRDPRASTDFADTRFLIPWLCDFTGWAIFMDCDQLMLGDVAKLYDLKDWSHTVMVRKHNHIPREDTKFLGATQHQYKCKNWSSLMIFNNAKCKALSPAYVSSAPGLDLHQFKWTHEHEIGEIPDYYNFLVGYEPYREGIQHIHYTEGGPYFNEYKNCPFSAEYVDYHQSMNYVKQRDEI